MTLRLRLVAGAALALLVASPAAAKPDVACLWAQLTPAQQASRIPAQPTGELAEPLTDLSPAQLGAMEQQCGLTQASRAEWLTALDMLGVETGQQRWLAQHGVAQTKLEAAWTAMPGADRRIIMEAARRLLGSENPNGEDTGPANDAVMRFITVLGLAADSEPARVAADFAVSRSLRLALQEKAGG